MNYTSSLRDTKKHIRIALSLSIQSTEECFVGLGKEMNRKIGKEEKCVEAVRLV